MQPLAIHAPLKWLRAVATLGPNTQSGVLGLRCLSLPETLLCSVGSAAAECPVLQRLWEHLQSGTAVGHRASSFTVWRNWEGGISSSPFQELIAKLPGDIWSSEKLTGNSIA